MNKKPNIFKIKSNFKPSGSQPVAIDALVGGIANGMKMQTLLGVTGSGKTFTIANVVEKVQKPTLVIAHNKTLAAQLCQEFREFFPDNAVEYFVSYYDYYQPEAYIPSSDTYIEKEAQINDEIDRLRHASTQALLTRRDVIIVASVSCIYGIGSPEAYQREVLTIFKNTDFNRDELINKLVTMQFIRNETNLTRGTFRAKGDVVEVMPVNREIIYRIQFCGDHIEDIIIRDYITGNSLEKPSSIVVFPARHYVIETPDQEKAFLEIEEELEGQWLDFNKKGKIVEADRLKRRTKYDLAMMREVGYCNGIENYSKFFDRRKTGEPPSTLIDFFSKDFLLVIDESHVTIPQINGMYAGDKSRKQNLINFGFRLPSASDNRPLRFHEFQKYMNNVICTTATPADFELQKSDQIVEQIIRPTGLVDPEIIVKPIENQVDDLIKRIKGRVEKKQRVLVTTLTKKMAEDFSEYLNQKDIRVRYLHSDIDTLERIEILRDLRRGSYDVLVGVNLLREGLDLPEVSLVAIMDADKEGFLRSAKSLIQTIGRAARNIDGQVVLYADVMTKSLVAAIGETNRRREIQIKYNKDNNITPKTIEKVIHSIVADETKFEPKLDSIEKELARGKDITKLLRKKELEMKDAAHDLQFELAAVLRDELIELKKLKKQQDKHIL